MREHARRGRPSRAPERSIARVVVWVTPAEKRQITEAARRERETPSAFVRGALADRLDRADEAL